MLDQDYQLDIASNFNDVADAPVAQKISDAVELHPRDDNEPVDILCKNFDGVEGRIQSPIQVLTARLKFVRLILLEDGCNPGSTDEENQIPSDYARQNGIWSQWGWALVTSGFCYDAGNDRGKSWGRTGAQHSSDLAVNAAVLRFVYNFYINICTVISANY